MRRRKLHRLASRRGLLSLGTAIEPTISSIAGRHVYPSSQSGRPGINPLCRAWPAPHRISHTAYLPRHADPAVVTPDPLSPSSRAPLTSQRLSPELKRKVDEIRAAREGQSPVVKDALSAAGDEGRIVWGDDLKKLSDQAKK